jgi:ABC-type nitrate/sulfonate/bicarbonate transport system substrate-binding protein
MVKRAPADSGEDEQMAVHSLTSRRIWAVSALATFLLGAFGAAASAETLRVGKAFPSAFGFVSVDVSMQEGIFKIHGLDIEITSLGGAPALIQAITAGSIDIGLESGTDLGTIPKGSRSRASARRWAHRSRSRLRSRLTAR